MYNPRKILGSASVIYLKFVFGISQIQIINLRSTSQQITEGPLIFTKASDNKRHKASKIIHPKIGYSPPKKLKKN